MSTDPTTTSQVQAYRFMLRRMQSALVRKDAVMLHEPMRHHLRATAVGLILGMFGLAAFFVVGRFSPTSDVSANEIVIGDPSGAVFVVQGDPLKLIPVPNVTSARLLVAAIAPGREAPAAQRVADTALANLGRLPATGLPGAPPLPAPENLIKGVWSVCDAPGPQPSTTVLVQERAPATRPLTDDQALLVAEPNTGVTYLVWRAGRARIDPRESAIQNYYRLGNVVPRKVSANLLNAIPEGRPLTLPVIPPARPFPELPGAQVGDVVRMKGVRDSYFLLLPEGKQLVEPAVVDLIRYQRSKSPEPTTVTPEAIARVPEAPVESQLDFDGFPARVPQILKNTDASTVCLTWQDPNQPAVITLNPEGLPLANGQSPVAIPSPAVSSQTADFVFLHPTKGALVRGVVPGQRSGSGAIWLVTDQGFRHGVPSIEVARSLGLGETPAPAPEPILALLPIGDSLDPDLLTPNP
ncbi:MAG: type VII secretion protein EccB [Pseudonocardiaceae bacterium]